MPVSAQVEPFDEHLDDVGPNSLLVYAYALDIASKTIGHEQRPHIFQGVSQAPAVHTTGGLGRSPQESQETVCCGSKVRLVL